MACVSAASGKLLAIAGNGWLNFLKYPILFSQILSAVTGDFPLPCLEDSPVCWGSPLLFGTEQATDISDITDMLSGLDGKYIPKLKELLGAYLKTITLAEKQNH